MPNQALVPVNTTLELCVVMPLIVAAPVAVKVLVLRWQWKCSVS